MYLITNDSGNASIIAASKQKLLLYGTAVKLIIWPQPKELTISIYSPVTGVVDGTDSMLAKWAYAEYNDNHDYLSVKEGDY
jgi:Cu(I)/Ag(I) efflux system membrane fusion protein